MSTLFHVEHSPSNSSFNSLPNTIQICSDVTSVSEIASHVHLHSAALFLLYCIYLFLCSVSLTETQAMKKKPSFSSPLNTWTM